MANVDVGACCHELVVFFDGWARAPIAPEMQPCPNGKTHADDGKRSSRPTEDCGWREDAARKKQPERRKVRRPCRNARRNECYQYRRSYQAQQPELLPYIS